MSILKILCYPDIRLRKIAKPVVNVDRHIRHIIDNMLVTMYAKEGIGLAATQVDIHEQIIVIDISKTQDQSLVLINPRLLYTSGEIIFNEGCLSIPNQQALITRANIIQIEALNYFGKYIKFVANSLLAICIQHELDHLVGKLFIDYLPSFKVQRTYQEIKKNKICSSIE